MSAAATQVAECDRRAAKRFAPTPARHTAFADLIDEASGTRYVGGDLLPLRTPHLVDFTVFDGRIDGEKCFDHYVLNRRAAASQLRTMRKAGMYIERLKLDDAYYVEPA